MHLSDFDYELPKELIAQHPCEKRDNSSLMYLLLKGRWKKGTAAGLWFSTEKKELLKTGRSTI